MEILHVLENVSARYGGPARVCKEISSALARSETRVTIFTTNRDYPKGKLDVPINTLVRQDGYNIWYFSVQFTPYMVSLDMMKALRLHTGEFDLLHIHGLYSFPSTIAAYYAKKFEIPYIMRPHGSLDPFLFYKPKNRLIKRIHEHLIERRNFNKAAAVHYTSQEEMALIPFKIKAPSLIMPLGIDLRKYENLPPVGTFKGKYNLKGKKLILHLGRINFKKGLDILVKGFARLSFDRNDVCLVLAGPDNEDYGKQVEKWIIDEGVKDKVVFTGMLHGIDKLAVLRDADIFALPSYSENFGIAVVEAMACELPVVISNKVNIWREIQKAGAGIVTSCDADEVANALKSLLDEASVRFRMGGAGKMLVNKTYNWEVVVNDMLKAYQDIVKHSRHKNYRQRIS